MDNQEDKNIANELLIQRMSIDMGYMAGDIADIKVTLDDFIKESRATYVTKKEFAMFMKVDFGQVKNGYLGFIGLLTTSVVIAIINLVVKK